MSVYLLFVWASLGACESHISHKSFFFNVLLEQLYYHEDFFAASVVFGFEALSSTCPQITVNGSYYPAKLPIESGQICWHLKFISFVLFLNSNSKPRKHQACVICEGVAAL